MAREILVLAGSDDDDATRELAARGLDDARFVPAEILPSAVVARDAGPELVRAPTESAPSASGRELPIA